VAYLFWVVCVDVWDADVWDADVWDADVWDADVPVDSVDVVSMGPGQLSPTLNFLAGAYMLGDVWFVWLECVDVWDADVWDADVWDADVWDADVPVDSVGSIVSMGVSLVRL